MLSCNRQLWPYLAVDTITTNWWESFVASMAAMQLDLRLSSYHVIFYTWLSFSFYSPFLLAIFFYPPHNCFPLRRLWLAPEGRQTHSLFSFPSFTLFLTTPTPLASMKQKGNSPQQAPSVWHRMGERPNFHIATFLRKSENVLKCGGSNGGSLICIC